ncbi:MAG TPA: hypothetical protein VF189_00740 [Patescibacteria group bacterium]
MPVEVLATERIAATAASPARRGQADAKQFTSEVSNSLEAKGCKPGPCLEPCKGACLQPPNCRLPKPGACKPPGPPNVR